MESGRQTKSSRHFSGRKSIKNSEQKESRERISFNIILERSPVWAIKKTDVSFFYQHFDSVHGPDWQSILDGRSEGQSADARVCDAPSPMPETY